MDSIVNIAQKIQKYDKVVLLPKELPVYFGHKTLDCMGIIPQRILILSTRQINIKEKQVAFHQINEETAMKLYSLYHTYEFTNNFVVLEQSSTFATLFHYVQTGILTPEEAWQALLGE